MAKTQVSKSILMVLQSNRRDTAACVQQVFTDFGCIIRTRIGLHDGVGTACSNHGLILLELVGDAKQHAKLAAALKHIKGVRAKLVSACF
jgi:hypothetical protein